MWWCLHADESSPPRSSTARSKTLLGDMVGTPKGSKLPAVGPPAHQPTSVIPAHRKRLPLLTFSAVPCCLPDLHRPSRADHSRGACDPTVHTCSASRWLQYLGTLLYQAASLDMHLEGQHQAPSTRHRHGVRSCPLPGQDGRHMHACTCRLAWSGWAWSMWCWCGWMGVPTLEQKDGKLDDHLGQVVRKLMQPPGQTLHSSEATIHIYLLCAHVCFLYV